MRPAHALAATGVLAVAGALGVALWMRSVESPPDPWHVDLAGHGGSDRPGFLAATPGYTRIAPDLILSPSGDPGDFLSRIDAIALAEPRTRRLAGAPEEGRITYVQRSLVFAFPDYVTVQADADGRAIWSRSRFGRSDLGVNRARVERWLGQPDR